MTALAALRTAYDRSGRAWYGGPQRVYRALAAALVEAAGESLAGRLALDAATGGGAVARALAAAGARVVASDAALGQLRPDAPARPPAVVADVGRLPFRAHVFGLAAAGFVLSHLTDPVAGLRELARVTRPGGLLLASAFAEAPTDPVKTAVESVAQRFDYQRPAWYDAFKRDFEPRVGTAAAMRGCADAAGLVAATVLERRIVLPLRADEIVGWRLGLPHFAPFVAGLPPDRRAALEAAASEALGDIREIRLPLLMLRGVTA